MIRKNHCVRGSSYSTNAPQRSQRPVDHLLVRETVWSFGHHLTGASSCMRAPLRRTAGRAIASSGIGGTKNTGNGHREAGRCRTDVFSEWQSIYIDFSGSCSAPKSTLEQL